MVSFSALSFLISPCTPHERGLGAVGVLLGRVEIGLQLADVGVELVLLLDQDDGQIVLVRLDRGVELGFGLRELLVACCTAARRRPRAGG